MSHTNFRWIVFALLLVSQSISPAFAVPRATGVVTTQPLKPTAHQAQTARVAAEFLTRYHYKPTPLDDEMSVAIFDHFLKSLDSEKMFFLKADIDYLTVKRNLLDDAILREDLSLPFFIFNLYTQRATERFTYARGLLKGGFDFTEKENYQYRRAKEEWPDLEDEANELWRKRVKNDWLRLRLAGKSDRSIVETLDKRYETSLKRIKKISSDDIFQGFMNAYTTAVEPHTNYFAPRIAEEFDIAMRLSLIGIGAVLAEKDDATLIRELVPGGPAAMSGKLKTGDRILGVAQGEAGAVVDIMGWRLDDVVALIRGAPDTTVRLVVLPVEASPDGKHVVISLVRKKITLEAQSAKKSIVPVVDGDVTRRIGVITLPGFYEDFAAKQRGVADFKSATRDVAKLLEALKKEKVDGILIDLRNNGGGSLTEAIDLTGLFVGKGPVVQQRDSKGSIAILRNTTREAAWDGPLGVLINRGSASASEIFAAAIQDYGRGIVIGEPSFGKGTVQTMVDLDKFANSDKQKYGELKFTIAQFFRIDGGTTQLRGVTPDIGFSVMSDTEDFGESNYENALPWMQIKPADYTPVDNVKALALLLKNRNADREKASKGFQCLRDDIAEINQLRKNNVVSLNEAERRREREAQEARQKECDLRADNSDITRKAAGVQKPSSRLRKSYRDDGLQADERNIVAELAEEKARKNTKDVLLDEAAHIISDQVGLIKQARLMNETKPRLSLIPE